MESYKLGVKATWVTIIINIILATFKVIAGILGNSSAIVADGIHTLSDVLTSFVVIAGLKVSSKKADHDHQYGHEKYESIFAKILSLMLLLTGVYIGYKAVLLLISGNAKTPKTIALIASLFSIAVKEGMYWYTINIAKKIKSVSMEADAWHHRSDVFSSIGTFVGVLGARLGITSLDPIAGLIVAVFIIRVGVGLYIKSVKELVDEAADVEIIKVIKEKTGEVEGVKGIKSLKTRVFGNSIYVDMEIFVEGHITVKAGHDISEEVHDKLEREISDIKHCMIHIEPFQ